jgi:hypothetical protein
MSLLTPKCPNCEKLLTHAIPHETRVGETLTLEGLRGLSLMCPYCNHFLGITVDPVSLKVDTVNEIVEELKPQLSAIQGLLTQIAHFLNSRR